MEEVAEELRAKKVLEELRLKKVLEELRLKKVAEEARLKKSAEEQAAKTAEEHAAKVAREAAATVQESPLPSAKVTFGAGVTVKKDQALTDADVFAYCKTQLTGYKRP